MAWLALVGNPPAQNPRVWPITEPSSAGYGDGPRLRAAKKSAGLSATEQAVLSRIPAQGLDLGGWSNALWYSPVFRRWKKAEHQALVNLVQRGVLFLLDESTYGVVPGYREPEGGPGSSNNQTYIVSRTPTWERISLPMCDYCGKVQAVRSVSSMGKTMPLCGPHADEFYRGARGQSNPRPISGMRRGHSESYDEARRNPLNKTEVRQLLSSGASSLSAAMQAAVSQGDSSFQGGDFDRVGYIIHEATRAAEIGSFVRSHAKILDSQERSVVDHEAGRLISQGRRIVMEARRTQGGWKPWPPSAMGNPRPISGMRRGHSESYDEARRNPRSRRNPQDHDLRALERAVALGDAMAAANTRGRNPPRCGFCSRPASAVKVTPSGTPICATCVKSYMSQNPQDSDMRALAMMCRGCGRTRKAKDKPYESFMGTSRRVEYYCRPCLTGEDRDISRRNPDDEIRRLERAAALGDAMAAARLKAARGRLAARRAPEIDEEALTELDLYLSNNGQIYPMRQRIEKNLRQKFRMGRYDGAKAPAAWMYWVEQGARAYARDYDAPGRWAQIFPRPLRLALATKIARQFEADPAGLRAHISSGWIAPGLRGENPTRSNPLTVTEAESLYARARRHLLQAAGLPLPERPALVSRAFEDAAVLRAMGYRGPASAVEAIAFETRLPIDRAWSQQRETLGQIAQRPTLRRSRQGTPVMAGATMGLEENPAAAGPEDYQEPSAARAYTKADRQRDHAQRLAAYWDRQGDRGAASHWRRVARDWQRASEREHRAHRERGVPMLANPGLNLPQHRVKGTITLDEAIRRNIPGIREAFNRFRKFHGGKVNPSAQVTIVDDGRRDNVAGFLIGRAPEITYDNVPDGSNKTGSPWVHKTSKQKPTYLVHVPTTNTTMLIGHMQVSDWLREPGENKRH